jgi:NAD(P)-dependent dehydrogenase (short-subunit alcohol dehydrogenase family)
MSRVLIITGASRGIGRATARRFADAGYTVHNLSRSPGGDADIHHLPVDLAAPDWAARCGDAIRRACDGAEQVVLVHSAGAHSNDAVTRFDAAAFARVMQVNVAAPAQLTALLVPQMKPGSSVLFVGSTLSEIAVANSCAYVTSKHALVGLMRSACQDLAGRGIHTACICPGFTDTEMLREHVGNSDEILRAIAGNVTFGRLIQPQEIAETLWICSQQPVLNGAVIHANLGQIQH